MNNRKTLLAVTGLSLALVCAARADETTLLFQGFETADTWTVQSGTGFISTATGSADTPPSQRILSGSASWQVSSNSAALVLADAAIPSLTGRLVRVRLSSTSGTSGNGADAGDAVRVFVALDGAAFSAQPDIFIGGTANARWGYWATQTVTTTAGTVASNTAPQGGTSSNNYSKLEVLIPDTATSVAVSVSAQNDNISEFWNVDDIAVLARTSAPTNLTFYVSAFSAGEAAGAVTVTVYKTAGAGNVSAQIALGGTATLGAGGDYTVDTTNLVLNGATTSATIVVTITNDILVESAETVVMSLTNVVNGGLSAPSTLTLTIVDDDLSPNAVSNVWINEVNYDPAGVDSNEFIEVAGAAGASLTNCTLVLYDGSSGLSYGTTNLSGTLGDEGCGFGAAAFYFATNGTAAGFLLNGAPDGVALVQGGKVVQFVGYEGFFTASNGPASGLVTTTNIGDVFQSTNTLQLAGTATNYGGFVWATNTPSPGTLNFAQFIAGCAGPIKLVFGTSAQSVSEAVGTVDVQVAKSAALSNVTAQLAVSGSATLGSDYTLSTTNITLTGAATSQVVQLTVIDDLALEPDETIILTLTNISAAVAGTPSVYTMTIAANDSLALAATSAALFVRSVTSTPVSGTANIVIGGELVWSNLLNGASGTTPAATNWTIPNVPLDIGLNTISVVGTNSFGNSLEYVHPITRLDAPRGYNQVIALQGFEAGETWGIVQGASGISTNRGPADFPPDQRIFSGTQSWQVINNSVTLELAQVSMSGFTGRQVNVRLSSTSLTSGNGAENTDLVLCYAALDGAAFPAETNYVMGSGGLINSRWGFWATNVAAMGAGSQARTFSWQGGLNSNNYSDLYILLPDSATSIAFKVWALNDSSSEVWNVDTIRLIGYSTNSSPDSDGDLLPDAWELDNFGTLTNGATGDLDGDGFNNLDEYIAGTQPTNSGAYLKMTAISNSSVTIVSFLGATGRLYRLDYSDDLRIGAGWTEYSNNIPGTNGLMYVPQGSTNATRSYRVRVQLP